MKNKNKGFTLIVLLVVVAIIGILAAVGTVAYTGYTSGAKKNSAKSNHAAVVKYIAAELQKCAMDSSAKGFDNATFCSTDYTAATTATAAVAALSDFKNPFYNADSAVVDKKKPATTSGSTDAPGDQGWVILTPDDTDTSNRFITVTTTTEPGTGAEKMSNEVSVE